jgi:ABC-2 type transport system ATP-binding protein
LKASTGIDTIVTVAADGDLEALSALLVREVDGATQAPVLEGTIPLGVQGPTGVLPQVVQVAERNGFRVTDLTISEPTLETVFIDLTGKELRD